MAYLGKLVDALVGERRIMICQNLKMDKGKWQLRAANLIKKHTIGDLVRSPSLCDYSGSDTYERPKIATHLRCINQVVKN